MASIRNIKKDIDYIVDEVISDSLLCISMQSKSSRDSFIQIINEMVEVRNSLIAKVNNAPKFEKKSESKAYYKAIYDELIASADKSFEKLSKLIEAK